MCGSVHFIKSAVGLYFMSDCSVETEKGLFVWITQFVKSFLCKSSALGEPKKYIFQNYCSSLLKTLWFPYCSAHESKIASKIALGVAVHFVFAYTR